MVGLMIFLLIDSSLYGVLCSTFQVSLVQTVRVLRGSCVTVPCSFDIPSKYEGNLNEQCEAKWVDKNKSNPQLTDTNAVTGDLTRKNCTTTFGNMRPDHSNTYYFRLDCSSSLRGTFTMAGVTLTVTDDLPSPTLTPSTLEVNDGDSVNLTCSAPVPCLSHPPNLTWTPTLGYSQETLQENQDKTFVKTSVLNFNASYLHDGEKISCTSVYRKQDGSADASFSTTAIILCRSCGQFEISLPQTVQVLRGSCVTVPCSFGMKRKYEQYLSGGCRALWVYSGSSDPRLTDTNPVTGNLTEKNCTTTFSNMQHGHSNTYNFRLDCNGLKYTFKTASVKIEVKDNFPSPTLTPSTLEMNDGDSVSLTCSAPVSCLSRPPNLTWTPTLGESEETLQENQDKTLVKISVLNFNASYLHDGEKISCNAVYQKQDGNSDTTLTSTTTILCRSCGQFEISLPQTVQVLRGSCVTVPCSFGMKRKYEQYLNGGCRALWVYSGSSDPRLTDTNPVTGNLTEKNCTTTFSNMQHGHSNTYNFRLDCNGLKYTFKSASVNIEVKDNFPSPTLTPSTLEMNDGDSVSLTCSAPVSCLSRPPNLTWTPTLGESEETLQENQDKTLVKISVLNFNASYLHDGEKVSCNAVYKKQDGNSDTTLTSTTTILCRSCGQFEISLPQTVQVLRGSCVTVPCSFGMKRKYEQYLNGGCRALWVYSDSSDPRLTDTNPVTGNLTEKNCTTTFSNMQHGHSNTYNFRLDCNGLKYTFKTASVKIEVKDNFPTPTLTPSTLVVKNGDSVSLTCSALVPCLSYPPNLTWTPPLHNSQEKLLENQGKTPMRISVLNFTASRQNHGQISCVAAYQKQDESRAVTFSTRVNIQCPECDKFEISLPQTVQVLSGTCVTIPCSFELQREYEKHLHGECTALWVYLESTDARLTDTNPVTGNLTEKNCTTTFYNVQPNHSSLYYFRLDCKTLRYTFKEASVKIDVKEHFPSPTLTVSILEGKEGDWVNLTCSTPSPCLTHPPTLTWTPKMGDIMETMQMSPNKSTAKTSVLSFIATNLHHRQNISCTATYKMGNGNSNSSLTTSLKTEILFRPKILPSSSCIKTTSQINCSCEIVGNPPILLWLFNGQPVNQSGKVYAISHSLNDTYLRSTITVNQQQERNLSSLLCFSFNSLGSDSKQLFINSPHIPAENQVSPRILPSSSCIQRINQINCSCEIVGNPPILQWFFNGQPVNQSENFVITDSLNGTYLRSTITVNQSQDRNLSSLLCFTFNSLGSDSKQLFINSPHISGENQVPPKILPSSACIKTRSQINCSCEIVGNPPMLQWLFNGQPVNQSGKGFIITDSMNGTYLRSTITVNQQQERNLSSLLCFSFNSLGSDSKQLFMNSPQIIAENQVPPRILPSSSCIKTTSQIDCSCEIVGNPPILLWLFNGQPVNQSGNVYAISHSLNGTYLRSTITVNQQQERNLSSLLCFSFNSLGSDSKQLFINSPRILGENQVSPRILPSSICFQRTNQINCSCEIVGNPPILQWFFNGQPVNQSENFVITDSLNGTYLRSTITVNQSQDRNLSSLLCFTFNSLGSDSKQLFINSPHISGENQVPPKILPSSACIETRSQINCSCEIVGNPPMLQWLFNGQLVNQSGKGFIITDSLNGTYLRSTITVNQQQERNLSSLLCFSFNSLGSDSKQLFINSPRILGENQVSPRILPSSSCIQRTNQINCSCEIVGNPPMLQWLFNGQPVNHSEVFVITDSLNGTYLRSTITVNQSQDRNLFSLLCFTFNSLGSDSKQLFIKSPQILAENQGKGQISVFISTTVILLVLVCVLLFVIRFQKTHHYPLYNIFGGKQTKVQNTSEDDISIKEITSIMKRGSLNNDVDDSL
uniref:Uncharacterized LOC111608103 n=1 Tax=Xiphophorus maculatus TaxID=8083 RepID=A0A3B5PSC3_XIPMA